MSPGRERAGFEQRILHARGLLLHGCEGLANLNGTNVPRAQIANFFHLQKIEEGVAFSGRKKSRPLPRDQLSRAHAQDSN